MQNFLLPAELGHWACVHAEFITIGRVESIGRVPMRIVSAGAVGKGGGGAWR